ncbi:MAG: hypothetical protein IJ783_09365, partial [Kiritimatiellae bacterium]|nr:hypothetical protein [Kiritimatiellia bacterium]
VRARAVCLVAACAVGAVAGFGPVWWALSALTVGCIFSYDRLKENFPRTGFVLMGLCRGLSVLAGHSAAAWAMSWPGAAWFFPFFDFDAFGLAVAFAMALAVTLYVGGLTALGAGEERAGGGLPRSRYVPALFPFAVLAVPAIFPFVAKDDPLCRVSFDGVFRCCQFMSTVLFGAASCAAAWCAAVRSLGVPHGPEERGDAVGAAIDGLMLFQLGAVVLPFVQYAEHGAVFAALAVSCAAVRFLFEFFEPSVKSS